MKHIKPLFEYEDEEIRGMIDDLETIGIGPLKGWLFIITNKHGLQTGEIIISDNWGEAQKIYSKHGIFEGREDIASYLSSLKSNSLIVFWDILDGFRARSHKKGYKKWNMNNPYETIEILETFFSNPKEILDRISINSLMVPRGIEDLQSP